MTKKQSTGEQLAESLNAVAASCDHAAFARLYAHYAPKVKTLAMRMGLDASHADEIAQETLLAVWRQAGTYDSARAAVSTWVYTIARNAIIDRMRRNRHATVPVIEAVALTFPDEHADLRIDRERRAQNLRAALAELPDEQAEVLRIFYFDGMSHGQIAQHLDLPLGTVKSRIRLAVARLRSALEDSS